MNMQYIKEGEFFVLCCDGEKTGQPLESLAVVFDKECGTLHKHGNPRFVKNWLDKTKSKFIAAGFADMAEKLVLIEGVFDLAEINRIISTSGYAKRFYDRLMPSQTP